MSEEICIGTNDVKTINVGVINHQDFKTQSDLHYTAIDIKGKPTDDEETEVQQDNFTNLKFNEEIAKSTHSDFNINDGIVTELYTDHEKKEELAIKPLVLQQAPTSDAYKTYLKVELCRLCNQYSTVGHKCIPDLNIPCDESVESETVNEIEENRVFICDVCKESFNAKNKLLRHLHSGYGKTFSCKICKDQFLCKSTLLHHERIHKKKPFCCTICRKCFAAKGGLAYHTLVHKEKRFQCEICQKWLREKISLDRHMLIHSGEKPFECDRCGMQFYTKGGIRSHMKFIHSGRIPFQCKICKKSLLSKLSLICHERIHSGDQPYVCEVCKRKFRQRNSLMRHKLIHNREPIGSHPYRVNNIRKEDKKFQCDICKAKFIVKSSLYAHIRKHRNRTILCKLCKKEFITIEGFHAHERIHNKDKKYQCGICERIFGQKCHLVRHKLVHREDKPYQCGICKMQFRRRSHLYCHENVHRKRFARYFLQKGLCVPEEDILLNLVSDLASRAAIVKLQRCMTYIGKRALP